MSRLQANYDRLVMFLAEFAHVSNDTTRARLLNEAAFNLEPESLHDIRCELIALRMDDAVLLESAA